MLIRFLLGNLKTRDDLFALGITGTTMLKRNLTEVDWIHLPLNTVTGCCEYGNGHSKWILTLVRKNSIR
jgi:hypothetical protein